MATSTTSTLAGTATAEPRVRRIGAADLGVALRKGLDDFWAKPSHIVFLGIIYPLVALFLSRLTFGYDILPLLFPLAAGFALIGPLAALGLYEISRRRERGEEVSWRDAFRVVRSPNIGAITRLGLVLAAIFLAWLGVAMAIYHQTLGAQPESLGAFTNRLFTTSEGWTLILVGNGVGFLFAVLALTISVVSFPMLIDRPVGAWTAVRTSTRAVLANPVPMLLWGLIVAAALVIGSVPLFVGLAIVVPVLGHATWHLYRRTVAD